MSKSKLIQSKNIVISTQCFPPTVGGIENLIKGLSDSLQKRKYNIFVFADAKNRNLEEKYDKDLKYEVVRYSGLKFIRRRRKSLDIKKFIHFKKNINSIICDTWKSAENLTKKSDIIFPKILCLAHGNDILIKRSLIRKRRIKKVFSKVRFVIANSQFTKNQIIKMGINSRKIKVIYPGINKLNLKKGKINKYIKKFNNFTPILITLARLEKRKNHKKVILAISELIKENKNLLYIIAGDGPEKKNLYKLINKLKLNKNIKLVGKVNEEEKVSLLEISDLHIMPTILDKRLSSVEGFGMSYIEAGIYNTPSISSGLGGTKESVKNKSTGLICNPESVNSIKNSILKIVDNKNYHKKISLNAKKFSQNFLWKNNIQNYLNLIKK